MKKTVRDTWRRLFGFGVPIPAARDEYLTESIHLTKVELRTELFKLMQLVESVESKANAAQTGANVAVRLAEAETKAADHALGQARTERDNARAELALAFQCQLAAEVARDKAEAALIEAQKTKPADVDTAALVILARDGDKEVIEALRVRLMQRGLLGINRRGQTGTEQGDRGRVTFAVDTRVPPGEYIVFPGEKKL